MNKRQLEVLRRQIRYWRDEVTLNPSWRAICDEFELQERIEGSLIRFQFKDKAWLREQAKRSGYGDLLLDDAPTGHRIDAARSGLVNEKLAPVTPEQQYVLLTSQGGKLPCAGVEKLQPRMSVRVAIDDLALALIDVLVIVENLDVFDHWHCTNLPAELGTAVATYRGHDSVAKGVCHLIERLPQTVQIVVFPDLDPDGLKIALTTPKVNSLLICDFTDDLIAVGSSDDFNKQHQAAKYLDGAELAAWQPLWTELKKHKRSIKQQHMLAHKVELRLIPLTK
ncbi:hypothetical protein DU002_11665 [Corallincola holothuriorum]|uniref:DUF7281 domain-containing protein n=1 Tax=Corallincola holothuriorum TaxID=2282215 RepID=A0A368NFZ6_9GAMM|nr:hypothetical protein [Corallincola holothuriorum]RCU49567.1 hypothetical protein DU002_11665 [Corallincola holothuriorum]